MWRIFWLRSVTVFFAVFADLETVKTLSANQTSCILLANQAKRAQLISFKLKLLKNTIDIHKVPIVARQFPQNTAQQCPAHQSLGALSCPTKSVFRMFPNQFPFHLVEQECVCDRCGLGSEALGRNTACLPNVDFEAVLEFNAERCEWEEKLRPKVTACQCTWTREVNVF
jgi:hypothetical protein